MRLNTKKEINDDFLVKLKPDKEQLETLKKVKFRLLFSSDAMSRFVLMSDSTLD